MPVQIEHVKLYLWNIGINSNYGQKYIVRFTQTFKSSLHFINTSTKKYLIHFSNIRFTSQTFFWDREFRYKCSLTFCPPANIFLLLWLVNNLNGYKILGCSLFLSVICPSDPFQGLPYTLSAWIFVSEEEKHHNRSLG